MALSVSIIKVEATFSRDGYALNKKIMKKWIYTHGYNQYRMAHKLGLSLSVFKQKLNSGDVFNEWQITRLVKIVHAKSAINIIRFNNRFQREFVWWEVFGKYREEANKGDKYGYGKVKRKKRRN